MTTIRREPFELRTSQAISCDTPEQAVAAIETLNALRRGYLSLTTPEGDVWGFSYLRQARTTERVYELRLRPWQVGRPTHGPLSPEDFLHYYVTSPWVKYPLLIDAHERMPFHNRPS